MSNAPVWDRPEPPSRPSPVPLSRELIVRTAVQLADEGGLDEVSLRKVASALNAGPMRLYGYIETKDELLDLMVDEVYGEITPPDPSADWRTGLRHVAHSIRDAAKRHEWFIDLLSGRPHQGPNALVHMETTLATVRFEDIDQVLGVTGTVMAYVYGAVRREITELRAERSSGMTEEQWQRASGPYMRRMLATGRFPVLGRVMFESRDHEPAEVFELGLDYVLDGVAARHGLR
ncbi:TetR/AcrR family transcriptional regulator [Nocardia sp. NRRL S-836]|uniref:TetR/AcrR family transcriptional regulator n=1 Tax=Nocardia sp. NRRL S-836 TaxID=1519492 RepID=UPI0006C6DB74|nr:TetR/AcrR family transcriptional regulator C-terminal domain-containing protein [Nocardia sp. NRRL S-836]KOV80560.1 TetR family transcriptional regulator [Nocardia sp. NRRL S-836]